MNKLLKLILIFTFFTACNAQKVTQTDVCLNVSDIKNLIKDEIIQLEKNNYIIDNEVLEKVNSTRSLTIFLKQEAFQLISKINIKSKKDIIDFKKFFKQEHFDYMKCQLKHNRIKDWKQLLKNQSFKKNDSIKNVLSKYKPWGDIYKEKKDKEILRLRSKYFYYSIPLFSRDKEYALIYRETSSSGSLFILKRINGHWTHYAISFVWTSD